MARDSIGFRGIHTDINKCQLIKIVVYLCGSPVYTASRLEI